MTAADTMTREENRDRIKVLRAKWRAEEAAHLAALRCKDCDAHGPGVVEDQWETFEDIPLCDACVSSRWSKRGAGIPREWEIENYDDPDLG